LFPGAVEILGLALDAFFCQSLIHHWVSVLLPESFLDEAFLFQINSQIHYLRIFWGQCGKFTASAPWLRIFFSVSIFCYPKNSQNNFLEKITLQPYYEKNLFYESSHILLCGVLHASLYEEKTIV
jgi:hypothetical protein